MVPGAEEVLALLELRAARASGRWDVVVVDCAPDRGDAAAAGAAGGPRLVHRPGPPRRAPRGQGPAAGAHPRGGRADAGGRGLRRRRAAARRARRGARRCSPARDASVRIVLTPESVVLAEARRSWTTLSLYGYRVDGVVANRVFPGRGRRRLARGLGARAGRRAGRGRGVLRRPAAVALGVPAAASRSASTALRDLAAATYDGADPLAVPDGRRAVPVTSAAAAARCCTWPCRWPTGADVDLARNGDDLVVTVGSYRRLLTVPAGLARHRVAGARVEDGELQVQVHGAERRGSSG